MAVTQYIGARYVPKFYEGSSGSEWDANVVYEPLTIVTWLGSSWTSKKTVPAAVGAPNLNPDYWVNTGNFNQQVAGLETTIAQMRSDMDDADADLDDKIDALSESVAGKADIKTLRKDALRGSYAHRGYGYNTQPIPENSLPAYYMAALCGFKGIEIDIQYDVNQEIVCMHDLTVDRTTNATGRLNTLSYQDIYLLDNVNGEVTTLHPPTLAQTLQLCKGCGLIPSIEFKWDALSPMVSIDKVIEMLEEYEVQDYILNAAPMTLWEDPKYRDIPKVDNEFSATGFTLEQVQELVDTYGNMIFYMRNALALPDNQFLDIAHQAGAMIIAWTTQPLTDQSDAPKADLYLSEISQIRNVIPQAMTVWHNPTMLSGATSDASNYKLKYRRAGNVVEVQGSIEQITLQTAFANLPVGYRPPHTKRFPVFCARSDRHYIGDLLIATDGNMLIQNTTDSELSTDLSFVIDVCFTIG